MATDTNITEILGVSYRSYDDYRFSYFLDWCLDISSKRRLPLRVLASSKELYSWYCTQWLYMVENTFKEDSKDYVEAGIADTKLYFDLLSVYPKSIEGYYPSVIIQMIKTELSSKHKI